MYVSFGLIKTSVKEVKKIHLFGWVKTTNILQNLV